MFKRIFVTVFFCSLASLSPFPVLCAAESSEAASTQNHPTAYTALRAVQKVFGDKALEQIVEVTGREGVPQPFLWRVTLREPNSTREVDVADGKIASQRTVVGKSMPGTRTLRLQELNLDSSGVFDAADAQARKVRVRFDSLNYILQLGENGRPIWVVELFNQDGNSIGKIRLAAYDGTIASVEGRLATMPVAAVTTPTTTASTSPPVVEHRPLSPPPVFVAPGAGSSTVTSTVVTEQRPTLNSDDGSEEGGFFTRAGRTLDHTNHTVQRGIDQTNETVKRSLKRTGATIQRFFVGHSDLDHEEARNSN